MVSENHESLRQWEEQTVRGFCANDWYQTKSITLKDSQFSRPDTSVRLSEILSEPARVHDISTCVGQ